MFALAHCRNADPPRFGKTMARATLRSFVSPPTVDDWLLRIAEAQDKEAFASLFKHYAPRLKSFVMSMGAAAPRADEVVQDSLLTVWRRSAQFDASRGTGAAWLFTITRNTFISHVRRQKHHEATDKDPAFVSEAPSPEDEAIVHQTRRKLMLALATLPEEQASVLRDAYMRGQPLREIAEQQRLPLGTVKTRARLALDKLRTVFSTKESL